MMDISGSSEELETSIESLGSSFLGRSVHEDDRHRRESSVTLRSHCTKGTCALGLGLQFRSRISPSPSKQKLRSSRRRRRSDQSRADASELDQSLTHLHHHSGHHHHHHHQHHHHSRSHHHHQEGSAPRPVLVVSSDEDEVENIHREGTVFRTPQRTTKESVSSTPETPIVQSLSETVLPNGCIASSPIDVNTGPGGEFTDVTDKCISPIKDPSLPAIVESSESGFEEGNVAGETVVASSPFAEVFVCARRFFSNAHSRSKLLSITSDYFSGVETPSKSKVRESTRRLSHRKSYNSFIAYSSDEELDDWMKKPKTNYTYSESLTYRERVTPDRRIDSPNMSRRTLRGLDPGQLQSRDFSYIPLDVGESHLNLRSRDVPRTMDALSDGSDTEDYEGIARRQRSSRSRSKDSYSNRNGSAFTRTFTQTTKTTTRTLSYGLDAESDVDDCTDTPLPHRAVPFIARGSTPLTRGTPPPQTTKLTKGYTLSKGLVTLSEDEEVSNSNSIIVWTRRTKKTVTRVVTYIFSTLLLGTIQTAAAAATAITSSAVDTSSASAATSSSEATSLSGAASSAEAASSTAAFSSSSSSSSFFTKTCTYITTKTHTVWSYITDSASYVTTSTSKGFHSCKEKVKAKPLWFWIPILFVILLLALTAYWWLLQSRGIAEDSNDSADEEFSFLSSVLAPLNGIASYLMFGLWHIWNGTLFLVYWIGDLVHSCLSASLAYLYYFIDAAQNALYYSYTSVKHFGYTLWLFLVDKSLATISIFKNFYGFLMPPTSEDSHEEVSNSDESWSLVSWLSSSFPTAWVTSAYTLTKETASSSWASLWSGCLWLITQTGEGITSAVNFLGWCLSAFLSALLAVLHWIWESILLLISYLGSTTSSAMYTSGALLANTTKSVSEGIKVAIAYLPFFGSSHSSTIKSTQKSEKYVEHVAKDPQVTVVAPDLKVEGLSLEEVVAKVIKSEDLHLMIASAIAENRQKENHEQLSQERLYGIVRSVIDVELEAIRSERVALAKDNQIGLVKQQQEELVNQLDKLGESLHSMEHAMVDKTGNVEQREMYEEQLSALKLNIGQLQGQLNKLQDDHHLLAGDVRGCCKDARLTLADVEKHVSLLLGDIFGFSDSQNEGAETEGDSVITKSWSAGELSAWLRSYFVAKDELETRLSSLVTTMQVQVNADASQSATAALQEAQDQTTQVIMDSVMEKLREELKLHQSMLDVQNAQASQEVKGLVQAEMNIARESLAEELKRHIESQTAFSEENIKHLIKISVNEAVSMSADGTKTEVDSVMAVLPSMIATKVSESISDALPEQVNIAVEKRVKTAVQDAVFATLPAMVSSKFEESMSVAIPNKIEEAVPEAVADTLSVVVPAAVAEAVSSAVNTTIAAAVAEAVAANKNSGCVMSSANGDGIASATVNISHGNSNVTLAGLAAHGLGAGLNETQVARIVKDALLKYDADRTGMVDHALESAGGTIVSTRCTENYQVNQAELSILGFPVYRYSTNNPRTVIQPDRMPGQCWAFKGSQGYIVIRLAGPVRPTGFSLEHIPKSLSPSGNIDSAPKHITVWGLKSDVEDGTKLGSYEYDQDGDPLQYFPVQEESHDFYPLIELKINNNHGNLQYTCVYRFRVHGIRQF